MPAGPYRLVLVEWEDSAQPVGSWSHLADAPELEVIECASVGWLVGQNARVLMLAPNLGDVANEANAQASGFIRIPRSCVKKIVDLTDATSSAPAPLSGPAKGPKRRGSSSATA